MGTMICYRHGTTSTWGCRECLKERLDKAVGEEAKKFRDDYAQSIKDALAHK